MFFKSARSRGRTHSILRGFVMAEVVYSNPVLALRGKIGDSPVVFYSARIKESRDVYSIYN